MIPVTQTKAGGADVPPEERGDCMAAAIASILELPIERVQIPHRDDEHWMDTVQRVLRPLGYAMVMANSDFWPDSYWLAGVTSLNSTYADGVPLLHMIVMKRGQVAHDPSPGRRYPVGTPRNQLAIDGAYVLVPLRYAASAAPPAGETGGDSGNTRGDERAEGRAVVGRADAGDEGLAAGVDRADTAPEQAAGDSRRADASAAGGPGLAEVAPPTGETGDGREPGAVRVTDAKSGEEITIDGKPLRGVLVRPPHDPSEGARA